MYPYTACFWHTVMHNTATAILLYFLCDRRLSDRDFALKPAKIGLLLLWDSILRIVPNNISVRSLHPGISRFWHSMVLHRTPAKYQHACHDRRLNDCNFTEISVDLAVKSRSLQRLLYEICGRLAGAIQCIMLRRKRAIQQYVDSPEMLLGTWRNIILK